MDLKGQTVLSNRMKTCLQHDCFETKKDLDIA